MKNKLISLLCVGVILASALVGCSTANTSKSPDNKSLTVEDPSKNVSATRTISTKLGDVDVPANPQRVVVQYLMGDIISLGIKPIGISEVYDGAAYHEITAGIKDLGHFGSWDVEAIMLLKPDLIITIDKEQVGKLSKIAPTVYVPYGDISTEERVTLIGQALNKEKEAKEVIGNYYANIEASKKKLQEAGFNNLTISVLEGDQKSMGVKGARFGAGMVAYNSLSLKAPEKVQKNIIDKNSFAEEISFEVLPEYCGDFIIRNVYEGVEDLTKNEIWNSLPSIKNNRLIEMEFGLSYYTDIYSANAQVNYITNALLKAHSSKVIGKDKQ
ncbi:ABC transporter substrate-binding protein [Clostridium sp. CF012]|uniref:ABC transporter substrate-binding protein n=1 Tax=Clostridium sp. CF012 TaxID=2843319 RepID=UPI001C0CF2DF|nr:ABC transporter substrate-binding protein [Clostridium sp. CF012]MBU3143052.1 ABC transporter substrate-binding protein [Clostridium sp. CF012]